MKDALKCKGFIGSVHFATEDRVFYGNVEGVNDLITFEGSTGVSLNQYINDAIKKEIASSDPDH